MFIAVVTFSRAVVLHLWVMTSLAVKGPFHRAYISDIYITLCNSSEITVVKEVLVGGGHHHIKNYSKGIQH